MVSLLLTLNTCNILHDVKNTEKGALYWKKNKSNNFERLQIEVFYPPESNPTLSSRPHPLPRNIYPLSVYKY